MQPAGIYHMLSSPLLADAVHLESTHTVPACTHVQVNSSRLDGSMKDRKSRFTEKEELIVFSQTASSGRQLIELHDRDDLMLQGACP